MSLDSVQWIYDAAHSGKIGKRPRMSKQLANLLDAYMLVHPFVHLHHLGTVGDERHKKESPTSYHLHEPPDAIDITSIGPYDLSDLEQRMEVATQFAAIGGVCYHAHNGKRGHLHVQTPGRYAGKYRSGEVHLT